MFLERLLKTNEPLISAAFDMQQHGVILPDTYILDLDMITRNAEAMKKEADSYGIKLYFMLKQLGRNPLVAKRIQEIGFAGAVCVDFREALTMKENGIRLGNVGHLVQTPWAAMDEIVSAHPDIMTVYSVEKAKEIGKAAARQGFVQPIMLRVLGKDDDLYPGQYGGFPLEGLDAVVTEIEKIDGVRIAGVCSFPCLLYSDETHEVMPMPNAETVKQAAKKLEERGYVTRERSAADARVLEVSLTPDGRALQGRAASVPQRMACHVPLTAEEAAELRRLLAKVLAGVREGE